MSVYIKGMEMPTRCERCGFLKVLYEPPICGLTETKVLGHGNARLDNCPLVPVPKHGDLIDKQVADELNKKDYEVMGSDRYTDYARSVVLNCLNAAPTIIPASEGGE